VNDAPERFIQLLKEFVASCESPRATGF